MFLFVHRRFFSPQIVVLVDCISSLSYVLYSLLYGQDDISKTPDGAYVQQDGQLAPALWIAKKAVFKVIKGLGSQSMGLRYCSPPCGLPSFRLAPVSPPWDTSMPYYILGRNLEEICTSG